MAFLMVSCGDDNAPEITITSPSDGSTFTTADSLSINFTITDDVDVASATYNVANNFDGNVTGLEGGSDTSVAVNTTAPAGATAGEYTLIVTATDDEGNVSSEEVAYTVE